MINVLLTAEPQKCYHVTRILNRRHKPTVREAGQKKAIVHGRLRWIVVLHVTNAGKFWLNMNFLLSFIEEEINQLLRRSNMFLFFI